MTEKKTSGEKIGKNFNSKLKFDNVVIKSFTQNSIVFKTVTISVKSWYEQELREIKHLNKQIKQTINKHLNLGLFSNKFVIDVADIPVEKTDTTCYCSFEYTLFLREHNIISPKLMSEYISPLMVAIYEEHYEGNQQTYLSKPKDLYYYERD